MSSMWKSILKIDEYVQEKLKEYREKLKRTTNPEEKVWLEERIKYYEQLEDK